MLLLFRLPTPKLRLTLITLQLAGGLLLLPVAGCSRPASSQSGASSPVPAIAIRDVQSQAKDTIVTVQGTVGDRVPLLGGMVYELQDGTGKIWILTQGQAPEKGQEVVVQGNLRYQSIPIAGKDQGSVYIEQ